MSTLSSVSEDILSLILTKVEWFNILGVYQTLKTSLTSRTS